MINTLNDPASLVEVAAASTFIYHKYKYAYRNCKLHIILYCIILYYIICKIRGSRGDKDVDAPLLKPCGVSARDVINNFTAL
jgi:hypothetical protein